MKDVLILAAILICSGLWIAGVGYLRFRFEDAYHSTETPWFLAIWLWPFGWLLAPLWLARWFYRAGVKLAQREKSGAALPQAKVRR